MLYQSIYSTVSLLALSTIFDGAASTPVKLRKREILPNAVASVPAHREIPPLHGSLMRAGHLTVRDALSDVELLNSHDWHWGSDPSLPIAHVIGSVDDDRRILSMDSFDSQLKSTDCSNDGNLITFSFNNDPIFKAAMDSFKWVNEEPGRSIFLVTEPPACGETKRQAYNATNVSFDYPNQAATFSVKKTTWKDGVDTKLRVESAGIQQNGPSNSTSIMQRRQSSNSGAAPANGQSASTDNTPSGTIPNTNATRSGQNDLVFSTSTATPVVTLENKFSKSFSKSVGDVQFGLNVHDSEITGQLDFTILADATAELLSFSVSPNGVGAHLNFELNATAAFTGQASDTLDLFTLSLEPVGIDSVFNVGPQLKLGGQYSIGPVSAELGLDFGVNLDVSDSAVATVDIFHSGNDQFTQWTPVFTPIGPTIDGSVSVSGSISPVLTLDIGASAFGEGFEVGLELTAPQVNLGLEADASTSGKVCDGSADGDVDVKVDITVSGELDYFGGLGSDNSEPNKKPLISATTTQLFSTCVPFGSGSPTASATPTSTAKVISWTVFQADQNCQSGSTIPEQAGEGDCVALSGSVSANSTAPIPLGPGVGASFSNENGCTIQFFADGDSSCSGAPVGDGLNDFTSSICVNSGDFSTPVTFVKATNCP
ncbi:hypothetical protein NA57DRAFT_73853 [Rhizodiscina lignyota]|uniref:Uncharacterized protein n=1 Tax=Rhizodiscina lignyota TaxID=1504668 RepID=A0A9P4M7B5_9PEZI|nr:hypothetical protein NA57DRAFT_73853 [Rhizodiscina lignyota]